MNILIMWLMSTIMFFLIMAIFSKEKSNFNISFECGFSTKKKDYIKYSMNMFNYSVLFLVLDLEIIILTPLTKNFKISLWNNMMTIFFVGMVFMMIKEWMKMILQWNKWDY